MFEDIMKEMEKLKKEMDEMNRRLSGQMNSVMENIKSTVKAPKIDFKDKGDKVVLRIELPEVKKEDIELYLNEQSMEIGAKVRKVEEVIGKGVYRAKKALGEFRKMMPLPVEIKPETVKTTFQNGVLLITAEKKNAPEKKAVKHRKKVAVKASNKKSRK